MRYPMLLSILCLGTGVAEAEPPAGFEVCLTADACEQQFGKLGLSGYFYAGPNYPVPGCFRKGSNVYFGTEGTEAEMAEAELSGVRERVWCETIPASTTAPATEAASTTAPATEAALETTESASTTMQATEVASTEAASSSTVQAATEAASTEATSSTVLASTAVPVTTEASSTDATTGTDDSGSLASSSTVPATQAASSETTAASIEATAAIEGAGTVETTGPTSEGTDEAADDSPLEKEPVFLDVVDFAGAATTPTDPSSTEAASSSASSVPATEAAATEATEAGGSNVASTVPATEAAAQTQPTEGDGLAAVETTEAPPLSDCPLAYDMGKSTYAQDEQVELGSQIFQCADSFYCNIAEWDVVLLEANPNAKELWDSAWALIGPCAGGTDGPVGIEADDSETASRDEVDESTTSSTKPKKDDVGEGKGGAAKIEGDKKPSGSGKKPGGSKNSGKGKDKGKSKSKNKGKVVQNKLLASTEQAEPDDKKLWILGAVFGGLCVALLGMYALKRKRKNRVDDREYDGAFSAREDEVPPVTSVTWGDEGNNEDGMVLESSKTEDYEAAITGRSGHSESRYSEDPSAVGNGSQIESRNASDLAGADACWTMIDCV